MTEAARLLRHARRRAGMTQRSLAERSGIAQSHVARIESSAIDPSVGTLATLLRACGTTLEALPGTGEGVDRTVMRALLKLSPAQRLARATAEANNLAKLDEAVGS